mmetsp:Transcript_29106/g.67506  ORF Transcript_29106/g.67506 Transcript_29106/m.67506 type:complete len:310 (+) Transcript_29106:58-987(+)
MHDPAWPATGLDKAGKALLRRKLPRISVRDPSSGGECEWDAPLHFEPPCRALERPKTAERLSPLTGVSFPAPLRLRARGEVPGPLGLYGSGDALVIPLDTQEAVKDVLAACAKGTAQVMDGSCLTLWALAETTQATQLEPFAARRISRSLAVEPIELVAERQGDGARGGPIRYGEGFRLRAAGCKTLYLGFPGGDGLCWKSADEAGFPKPAGTRFSAHQGELGAPVCFGRPVSLRWVPTPPASDTESGSEDERLEGPKESSQQPVRGSPQCLLPEAAKYAEEGLYSRLADKANAPVAVTFLPLCMDVLS